MTSSPAAPCTPDRSALIALLADVEQASGYPPLSDPLAIDLRNGAGTLTARCLGDRLVGLAQRSPGDERDQLQTVVDPALDASATNALVVDLASEILGDDDRSVDWWVFGDDDHAQAAGAAADALGFRLDRELLIMERTLPTPTRATVTTRPFVPGVDDQAWLAVNNRAFAGHAEQGGWTQATLDHRLGEAWFDADGFRLYEQDGTLLAFCWTKVHGVGPEREGEIYVIGVDPVAHGRGLGRQLTQAGLDWIADQGITAALLYVAADNEAAVGLYTSMGFTVRRRDRAFRRDPAHG